MNNEILVDPEIEVAEISVSPIHMGSCQNYGPFLGTLNNRCRIIIGTQKGTLILTTTHILQAGSSSRFLDNLGCPLISGLGFGVYLGCQEGVGLTALESWLCFREHIVILVTTTGQ